MNKQKKTRLHQTYQRFLNAGLGLESAEGLNEIVDDRLMGFGTALDEKILNLEGLQELLARQKEQSVGLDMHWEIKPLAHYTSDDENTAFFADELFLHTAVDGQPFEMYLRFSIVLSCVNNQWKVIHWHGSKPENVQSNEDTFGIENWKQKAEALAKLVEERTADLQGKNRELEIEASLERVRAVALSMNQPAGMLRVCKMISQQLQALNVPQIRNVQTAIFYKEKGTYMNYEYYTRHDKTIVTETAYTNNKIHRAFAEQMQKGKGEFFSTHLSGQEVKDWLAYQKTTNVFIDDFLNAASSLNYYWYSLGPVALGISTYEALREEDIHLFKRFTNVFDLAYRRYLDIENAEAQAREAQIEVALERVRSRAMAMQSSDELKTLIGTLFAELTKLDLTLTRCIIWVFEPETNNAKWWMANSEDAANPVSFLIQHHDYPAYLAFVNAWKNGTEKFVYDLKGEDKIQWDDILFTQTELKNLPAFVKDGMRAPARIILSGSFNNFGGISVSSTESLSAEHFDILLRFARVFDLTYTRFNDLKQAEAQAREAQIQLALERVRARTMAMQRSDELPEAANLLFQQIQELGMPAWSAGYCIWDDDKKGITLWMSSEGVLQPPFKAPLTRDPSFIHMREAYERGEKFYVEEVGGDELKNHYRYMRSLPVVGEVLDSIIEAGHPLPTFQIFHLAFFLEGFLLFITYQPVPEAHEIFKRFGKTFEQTYTRFLDLQRAEAQAKEARIEAALERVRSRTMAMHKSSELLEAADLLFDQLRQLGAQLQGVAFAICDKDSPMVQKWTSIGVFTHPYDIDPGEQRMYEAWKNGTGIYEEVYEGEKQKKYFEAFLKIPEFREGLQKFIDAGYPIPAWQKNHAVPFQHGYLLFITLAPFNETQIFLRFGKVFEQTYTRFLDLKKAEAQAREVQVELSLERVRAKTMAMHNSNDVSAVTALMFNEFSNLGIENFRCGIALLHEDSYLMEVWGASVTADGHEVKGMGQVDLNGHTLWKEMYTDWKLKKESFLYHLTGEDKKAYYRVLMGEQRYKAAYLTEDQPDHYCYVTYFTDGVIFNFHQTLYNDEQKQILKRFATVFSLTYRRYNDLKKAEAQAREAQIEAALERVRSRTLAMQKSDELAETSAVLFKQLIGLGISPNRLYISIVKNDGGDTEFWITGEDGSKVSMAYEDNLNNNTSFKKMFSGWKRRQKSLVLDMQGEELKEYLAYLESIHVPFKGGLEQKRRLQYIAYFSKGFIGMASPDEQPPETLQLLERFAYVFNLTFTRFNDLQMAEAHALQAEQDLIEIKAARTKAEQALTELQAAQKQLVQSEKMASLGELTAGIAHEIQNPLNFVNNFSEVSKELLDEMKAALENGDKNEVEELANDIIQNLEKIAHHGKRADAIVKGMLQHSRASSGQKEPTDINALCDEYLHLAYHGWRAKDKAFTAKFETDFDERIGKINILPQEVGRVILNLVNNAFYAVNEKKKSSGDQYQPVVRIRTQKAAGKVLIDVSDNGSGIPEKIKDKIFHPFFTTKPAGQGTGLGLSLAYDVITKGHGGELSVKTTKGEGTSFGIQIPLV